MSGNDFKYFGNEFYSKYAFFNGWSFHDDHTVNNGSFYLTFVAIGNLSVNGEQFKSDKWKFGKKINLVDIMD